MQKQLWLLEVPEKRQTAEAWVWFKDGWQLFVRRAGEWLLYMLASILLLMVGVLVFRGLSGGLSQVALLSWLAQLLSLLGVSWVLLSVQAGLYRSMARVARGEKVVMADAYWLLLQFKHRQVWRLVALVCGFNVCLQWAQALWVGEIVMLSEGVRVDAVQLQRLMILSALYWVVFTTLTWAVLPMLVEFDERSLWGHVQRNWQGTWRNWAGLSLLFVLILGAVIVGAVLAAVLGLVLPWLQVLLLLLLLLVVQPLMGAWVFSAYRHIFTRW
ncbi:hypothetical protein [Rappaport israeli]|uniref:hypothetical protein n=1 Tax=Rappaport israeli TaxID=1839807 RepID=UPI000B1DEB7E|nr:hypothetical protein [Rappaport israeli]